MTPADDSVLDERLPDEVVEALAHGREDLVDEAILAALPDRDVWKAQVAEARALAIDIGLVMREAEVPELDLDAMVSEAIARQPIAPSRRSLWIASGVGLSATVGLAIAAFSDLRIPTPSDVFKVAGLAVTFLGAIDAMVQSLPGGWGMLGLALAAVLVVLAVPARVLARGGMRAAGVLLIACAAFASFDSVASAQTFTGDWPTDENISLSVEAEPIHDALRKAADAADVSIVLHETPDRDVSVVVQGASLRDVLAALLVDTDLAVHRSGNMVVVRPAPTATQNRGQGQNQGQGQEQSQNQNQEQQEQARTPTLPVPILPAVPPIPVAPPGGSFPERTTFGEDIRVGQGETVHSVFTMGGDAEILGRVIDNVVSMGGDVVVRTGGVVGGDVMTTGGDLEVEPGGVVQGRVATLGGEVDLAEGASAIQWHAPPQQQARGETVAQRLVGAGAGFGLLFLLGLVLVGSMSERHTHLVRAIVKQPIRSGMTGILGVIGAVVATVVLIITVIGIPGAIVVGLGGFVGVYAGMAVAASVLGAALPIAALKNRPVAQLGAGVAILYVAWIFPLGIGRLAVLLLAMLGFGAILLTRFGKRDIVAP